MGFADSGVGEALRAERLRQRRSIDQIARETRIPPRMLDAIEREDMETLPGLLFARNFVKQYATALGMEPAPLLGAMPALDIESSPMPQAPQRERDRPAWNPAWNGAISSIVWLGLAVAAAVAAYVHFNRPLETQANSIVAAAAPRPEPARVAAERHGEAPAPSVTSSAAPAAVSAPVKDVAESTAPESGNSETGSGHKVNVVISARVDSWIEVSEDGKTVFSGILKPNESKEFSSDDPIKLIAGNAGGVTVSLNGRALDPLGAEGQVKVLSLTGEGPRAAGRAPQPAPNQL